MTREEMLDGLYEIKNWKCNGDDKMHEAVTEAIKALEQEPCEDAISRQATIEAFQMFRRYESNRNHKEWVDLIETVLNQLPPVKTQEPKDMPRNSFCPNCGACMKDCRTLDEFIEDSKESEE